MARGGVRSNVVPYISPESLYLQNPSKCQETHVSVWPKVTQKMKLLVTLTCISRVYLMHRAPNLHYWDCKDHSSLFLFFSLRRIIMCLCSSSIDFFFFFLQLLASDGVQQSAPVTVTVSVLDANDNTPTFSNVSYSINLFTNMLPGETVLQVLTGKSAQLWSLFGTHKCNCWNAFVCFAPADCSWSRRGSERWSHLSDPGRWSGEVSFRQQVNAFITQYDNAVCWASKTLQPNLEFMIGDNSNEY